MTQSIPPVAATKPSHQTHHNITIEDPYAWLRDPGYPEVTDPEVLAYLNAENDYFEAYIEPLQDQVEMLFAEMKARQAEDDASVPYRKNGWWYQWRYAAGNQYRTWHRRADGAENWQLLLDENQLAAEADFFKLGALAVSPDGRKLAYSADTSGGERFTLNVIDLQTGSAVIEPVPETLGQVVWHADSAQLLYVEVSAEWRPYKVWHLDLASAGRTALYEEEDASFFVGIDLTQSERFVLLSSGSHTESEIRLLPRDDFQATPKLIAPRRANHEYSVDHRHTQLLILSNREVENFAVYTTDENAPEEANWHTVVAGDERTYLTGLLALDAYVVVEERIDGLDQIRVLEPGADLLTAQHVDAGHYIEFPEPAYQASLGTVAEFSTNTLRLSYTSMVTPGTVLYYDIPTRQQQTLKVQQIPSGYDAGQFVTERRLITARDGTAVPVSLVRHTATPTDGSAPLYLYGYGAYGIAIPPSFSTTRLSLLERGFIYAIAHIRGGDDLGYHWYRSGKLTQRTNTFNDFVDCAQGLIDAGLAQRGRIAIAGGSAGGELMGAVVNQDPGLWGAVAAHVPFVDVLNTMLDGSLPLTPIEWPEWGNPIEDPDAFATIRDYSPYDQLQPARYPPMLVTAGLNDPRVTYWEPAKYVAKLRTLKQDDNVLLLKTNMEAGHGGKSGRFEALRESAEEFAFFLRELADKAPADSR